MDMRGRKRSGTLGTTVNLWITLPYLLQARRHPFTNHPSFDFSGQKVESRRPEVYACAGSLPRERIKVAAARGTVNDAEANTARPPLTPPPSMTTDMALR